MEDAIIQLQIDTLDSTQDAVALLRKAYLVARKLKLKEFESWIYSELNGYKASDVIPDYRYIYGQVKYNNPINGWQNILFGDSELESVFSKSVSKESVPKLIDLLKRDGDIGIPMPAEIQTELNQLIKSPMHFQCVLRIDRSALSNIIDTTKNKILEWAIMLEENDIRGTGMRFTKEEIETAKSPSIVHYTTNIYGSITDSQIQQGTNNSEQLMK